MEKAYMSINEAARATGLAASYLREAVRSGRVRHIKSGKKYYINVPALLAMLEEESVGNVSDKG